MSSDARLWITTSQVVTSLPVGLAAMFHNISYATVAATDHCRP